MTERGAGRGDTCRRELHHEVTEPQEVTELVFRRLRWLQLPHGQVRDDLIDQPEAIERACSGTESEVACSVVL